MTGVQTCALPIYRFSTRVLFNETSDFTTAFNATSPGQNLYQFKRTIWNVGAAYQLNPRLSLTLDVSNLFNEPQRTYRGFTDRMSGTIINGTSLTFGVNGRF